MQKENEVKTQEKHKRRDRPDRDKRRTDKKEESDLEERVLFVNRCSKVLKGGRKFSFSALVLVGDRKGLVGFGFGKANELTDAIGKAKSCAVRDAIKLDVSKGTIPHELRIRKGGVSIFIRPAPKGKGVVAGSILRQVLKLAGYQDVVAKNLKGNNPINQIHAIFRALRSLRSREELLSAREAGKE